MALVMKFGGTSVGSNEALNQVLQIVQREYQQRKQVVIVTSAMSGVTDFLVQLIDSALQEDHSAIETHIDALRQKHHKVMDYWLPAERYNDLWHEVDYDLEALYAELRSNAAQITRSGRASGQLKDAILSMGERMMARVLAAILRVNDVPGQPIDASEFLVTDDCFQNAQPLYEPSLENVRRVLTPILKNDRVPVVTGYIGATRDGQITTLGRGGSDYSATYLASLLDADAAWIWTDVNGVMSGDPRKLKNAQIINSISYHAVSEFAYFGAKVLHPRAVEPLITPKIPLRVCNTFNPDYTGTLINNHDPDKPKWLNAVTDIQGILVFAPTLSTEQSVGTSPPSIQELTEDVLKQQLHQPVSPVITVDSHTGRLLCYVVPTTSHKTATQESVAVLQAELSQIYPDTAWRVEPVAIVAAIGVVDVQQTMQVLNAVRAVKADLLAMGQGSPECALLVVPPNQATRVIKRLHNMAVSAHHRLSLGTDDALCPPIPGLPSNRRTRTTRSKRGPTTPPHRSIPL